MIEELAKEYLEQPAPHSLLVGVGDYVVQLNTNEPRLIELLADYFAPFVQSGVEPDRAVVAIEADEPDLGLSFTDWPRDPGKVGRKEECADLADGRVVRKVRTRMQFLVSPTIRVAVGPCLENYNQIVNFINAQFITNFLDSGYALCHAAGVVRGTRGLAVAGMSGGGKSTLAMHLMSSGFDFTSNDRVLIHREEGAARMAGIPKMPRINPGTLLNNADLTEILPAQRRAELAAMPIEELWQLEEKYDVLIRDVYGPTRFAMVSSLDAFVILNWNVRNTEETRLERVDLSVRRDLLPAVMKPAGPFYFPANGEPPPAMWVDPEVYLAELEHVPVFEATGKVNFEFAVAECQRILDGCDSGA